VSGKVTVLTTTSPGYSKRVAVTSIWQPVVQESEGKGDELGVGVSVRSMVRSIVVGMIWVSVIVESIVETTVLAGNWVVTVATVPEMETVVVVVSRGSVMVDRIVLTVVEMTVCVITAVSVGPVTVIGTD
jgi:hypothetical protein